jgi:hypothetical protein
MEYLRRKGGSSSEATPAGALEEASWPIRPFLARVEEVLNLDGYQVLRYDRAGRQVYLDIELLAQLSTSNREREQAAPCRTLENTRGTLYGS